MERKVRCDVLETIQTISSQHALLLNEPHSGLSPGFLRTLPDDKMRLLHLETSRENSQSIHAGRALHQSSHQHSLHGKRRGETCHSASVADLPPARFPQAASPVSEHISAQD